MCECMRCRACIACYEDTYNPFCFKCIVVQRKKEEKLSLKQTKSSITKCPRITKTFSLLPNTVHFYIDFAFQKPEKWSYRSKLKGYVEIKQSWTKWKQEQQQRKNTYMNRTEQNNAVIMIAVGIRSKNSSQANCSHGETNNNNSHRNNNISRSSSSINNGWRSTMMYLFMVLLLRERGKVHLHLTCTRMHATDTNTYAVSVYLLFYWSILTSAWQIFTINTDVLFPLNVTFSRSRIEWHQCLYEMCPI